MRTTADTWHVVTLHSLRSPAFLHALRAVITAVLILCGCSCGRLAELRHSYSPDGVTSRSLSAICHQSHSSTPRQLDTCGLRNPILTHTPYYSESGPSTEGGMETNCLQFRSRGESFPPELGRLTHERFINLVVLLCGICLL